MFVHICFLSKSLVAEVALVGFLLCVNAEVIHKVPCLIEDFVSIIILAYIQSGSLLFVFIWVVFNFILVAFQCIIVDQVLAFCTHIAFAVTIRFLCAKASS